MVRHDPFFWDTVQLGSKHAHFFYENDLRWALLPTEIDSGHPPVFGYILAVLWTVCGKTLAVGHWAIFPFLVGIALLLYRFGQQIGPDGWGWALPVLVFADPVMAGQSALVGPDIPLVFFFLLAVFALLNGRRFLAVLAVLGLCAISMRGMMTAAALFVWQVAVHWPKSLQPRAILRTGLLFLPGVAFAAIFLWWHHRAAGWTGYHPDSPWAATFQPVDGSGFLRNVLVLGWRWLDFGRVFVWLALGLLVFRGGLSRGEKNWRPFVLLLMALVLFLSPSALLCQNVSAHRYFLPAFVALHLLVFHLLSRVSWGCWQKKALLVGWFVGLGAGNFWIYPPGIAMGWDSTLAHRPYHHLRQNMLAYIEKKKIPLSDIGTAFPNVNSGEHLLLNGDQRVFAEIDFEKNRYILVSNVFNDFSKKDFEKLQREWLLQKNLAHQGVWLTLYKKP